MSHHRKTASRRRTENRIKLYTGAGVASFTGTFLAVLYAGGGL